MSSFAEEEDPELMAPEAEPVLPRPAGGEVRERKRERERGRLICIHD